MEEEAQHYYDYYLCLPQWQVTIPTKELHILGSMLVLMEHQQRLVKENISPLEIDEHFFKHKEIVPIATYAAKLNKALKTKGTIVSISDILDNELNLKK